MRGFSQSEIDIPGTHRVTEAVHFFNQQSRGFKVTVVYEYIPLRKRDSVPIEATAFPRDSANNGFIVITWETNTKENWDKAKKIMEELLEILEGTADEERSEMVSTGKC